MRIFLDEQPCQVKASNVGEAISACAAMAEQRGRLIVDVIVDGQPWSDEQLSSTEQGQESAEELRLSTAEPAELVGQTFAQAAEALGEARLIQDDAAAMLQTDDHAGAMDRLHEAFSIWLSVQQAVVQGSQLVGLDLDSCTVEDRPVQQIISGLNQRLESLHGQLQRQDTVGVADTLLYELPEVVDQWQNLLNDLQTLVENK